MLEIVGCQSNTVRRLGGEGEPGKIISLLWKLVHPQISECQFGVLRRDKDVMDLSRCPCYHRLITGLTRPPITSFNFIILSLIVVL